VQLPEFPSPQQPPGPSGLSKAWPLAPETPWTTRRRALIDKSFCIRMTVVVEHYEIGRERT
jgi:hypothetical protein